MNRKTSTTTEDRLQVEGVGAKGFGIIPRYAMLDPDLRWWDKLLYAYLCSIAGSGDQTFPKRETTLRHLHISKDTYYDAQKALIEQGYISVTKTRKGNRQGINVYTLLSCPPKVKTGRSIVSSDTLMTNRVIAGGLKAGGYGIIYRQIMRDDRLFTKTKLVYAYLASYAGAGVNAFPSVPTALEHLQLKQRMWQRAIRELSVCGYLDVRQRRTKGQFDVCDYFLLDVSQKQSDKKTKQKHLPVVGLKDTEDPPPMVGLKDTEDPSPMVGLKDTENPSPMVDLKDTENPSPMVGLKDAETSPVDSLKDTEPLSPMDSLKDTENADTYYKNLSTVYLSSNNNQSIYQQRETAKNGSAQTDGSGDRLIDYETVQNQLKVQFQMDQEDRAKEIYGSDLNTAQELLNLLADVLSAPGETFQMGNGRKPKARLWELRSAHLLYVIDSIKKQYGQRQISNLRAYRLAALYHASETLSGYLEMQAATKQRDEDRRRKAMKSMEENQRLLRLMKGEDAAPC